MKSSRSFLLLTALGAVAGVVLAETSLTPATTKPAAITTSATGFDYSRGSYGFAQKTEVFSVPLDLGYESGSWTWRANLSYLTIKGPATVVGSGAVARPTTSSQSGFGDVYLGATYRFGPVVDEWHLDATARVKLPTASDSRGLGTGETDLYGQLDAYRTFGNITPFATVGYRALGDSVAYPLKSGVYVAGGAHFRAGPQTIVTVSADWGQRMLAGSDNTADAFVAVTHDVNERWRVMGYVLTGFTDASPDFGAGARITYKF